MWDEEQLDSFYTNENLMKRERVNVGNWKGQKKRQLMLLFFFVAVSWVVCLLQGCMYLKLVVVVCGVSCFMAIATITICLISLDGVWQWFILVGEVVDGIDEWEHGRTYLMSCIS
jgi:hypothetical protein